MPQYGAGGFSGGGVDLSHLVQRAQQPNPAASGAVGSATPHSAGNSQVVDIPAVVFNITEESFQQAAQLSGVVPVVVNIWSSHSAESMALNPVLEEVTREFNGQLVLGMAEADNNVELVQAFQVQALPAVVALVSGRPVPLFQGAVSEDQVRDLFQQLVQLAQQQGITGRVSAPDLDANDPNSPAEPAVPPVNPAHVPALEALEQGDFAAAVTAYEQVLLKAPADVEAKAALVQVRLLHRLDGHTTEQIRVAAGANPEDIEAQLLVADLDLSGGHIEDALLRVLDLFASSTDTKERAMIKERLLELFEVVGVSDPRVAAARARLANLLY